MPSASSRRTRNRGNADNPLNRFRDSFPQSLARDTLLTTLWADVCDLAEEMQTNSGFKWNVILCGVLVALVSVFNYSVSINASNRMVFCRIASIVAFFLIKQEVSLPFQPDSLMRQYRGKMVPFLINGIVRIITQSCTAYIAGVDSLISMHIIAMWTIVTVFEIFTSLDLRVYDKLLCHSPQHLTSEVKNQLKRDKSTLELAVNVHHLCFGAYVFAQYVLYTIHALNLVSFNLVALQWASTILTLLSALYLELVYQPNLANQSHFVLPTRFFMHLLYLHFTVFSGLYFTYPVVLQKFELHASVLFIAFCGCIAILNLVLSELKSHRAFSSPDAEPTNPSQTNVVPQQPQVQTQEEFKEMDVSSAIESITAALGLNTTTGAASMRLPTQCLFQVPSSVSADFILHKIEIPPGLYLTSISISANSVYILKRFQNFVVTDLLGFLPAPWNQLWRVGILLPLLTATFLWCESPWFYLLTVAFSNYI